MIKKHSSAFFLQQSIQNTASWAFATAENKTYTGLEWERICKNKKIYKQQNIV